MLISLMSLVVAASSLGIENIKQKSLASFALTDCVYPNHNYQALTAVDCNLECKFPNKVEFKHGSR